MRSMHLASHGRSLDTWCVPDQVCMLQDIGAGYLSDALKVRLAGWLHYCRERLADYHGGIELVDVFVSVLEQLGQFLGGIQ